jgi:hypothetical protein
MDANEAAHFGAGGEGQTFVGSVNEAAPAAPPEALLAAFASSTMAVRRTAARTAPRKAQC